MSRRSGWNRMKSSFGSHQAGFGTHSPADEYEDANRGNAYAPKRGGCRLPTKKEDYDKMSVPVKEYRLEDKP